MSILPKLMKAYQDQGLTPLTGYAPQHFAGFPDVQFTRFLTRDKAIVGMIGLALQEIMFLEPLGGMLSPKNILVVGNALGWSTVALSLIFPDARVVAIDPDQEGNDLTNRIAEAGGLNMRAVEGFSPGDVKSVVARHLDGPPELFLIDAVHTSEAIVEDFAVCQAVGAPDSFYLFHDVINCGLVDGVNRIRATSGLTVRVLTRTPSGMAVAYPKVPQAVAEYVACFTDENMDAYRAYRQLAVEMNVDKAAREVAKL